MATITMTSSCDGVNPDTLCFFGPLLGTKLLFYISSENQKSKWKGEGSSKRIHIDYLDTLKKEGQTTTSAAWPNPCQIIELLPQPEERRP